MKFLMKLIGYIEAQLSGIPKWMQAFVVLAVMIAMEITFVWWSFLILAAVAGFFSLAYQVRRPQSKRAIAAIGTVSWLGMALFDDLASGWRVSLRLAGLFHLPYGIGIYLVLALVLGILTALAAGIGQNLRIFLNQRERTQRSI